MIHLFVMDPISSLHIEGDSTFAVMRAATDRGDTLYACEPKHLFVHDGVCYAHAQPVTAHHHEPYFKTAPAMKLRCQDTDVVWMRKDPPFDMAYILATYMLDLIAPPTTIVNDPKGLKLFNEKIWAMHFAALQPPTLLAQDLDQIMAFVGAQPEGTVLKPWDGNGGRGVLITHAGDKNLRSMIELLTQGASTPIIAQAYIPDVSKGDKRILLFDGEPVAAISRVPGATDHRANLHVGAQAQATTLTPRDLEICHILRDPLKNHGQFFVGIDVIAGYLTEINVTSPTGFREVEQLYNRDLGQELLARLDTRLTSGSST